MWLAQQCGFVSVLHRVQRVSASCRRVAYLKFSFDLKTSAKRDYSKHTHMLPTHEYNKESK